MAKILVLAPSGFGKTTSVGNIESLGIKGLDPKETFIISATSKPLPFPKSSLLYPSGMPNDKDVKRYISSDGAKIGKAINHIVDNRKEIKNIILDDANYVMQDYYMANAMKKGFDVFKEIGQFMNSIFIAMENANNINFFMLAHYEEYRDSSNETISYRFKTVGTMVQSYITPEGKFDIVLFGKQTYDDQNKKVNKKFVTNFDGQFPSKSPVGMFDDLYIPNDLGLIKSKVDEYYGI